MGNKTKANIKESDYLQYYTTEESLTLKNGEVLNGFTLCYETYGSLNTDKSNAILIFHALSGDSHIASHHETDRAGWWDICVGPNKYIDTNKFFVICANVLGGCSGSTGPESINPKTGSVYGPAFPSIKIEDMVSAQKILIDSMNIQQLHAIIGGSMGGQLALAWDAAFPETTARIIVIASSARLSSQALAFDIVGRNAIRHDENFHAGNYSEQKVTPNSGLAIARMIGHITYLSAEGMRHKFEESRNKPTEVDTSFEKLFSVGSYLGYQGDKFVERFDANSYITLTQALDTFDFGETAESINTKLQNSSSKWLIISFSSDWLFPPEDSMKIVKALTLSHIPVSYHCIESNAGHDAFLLKNDSNKYGKLIASFITPSPSSDIKCCDSNSDNHIFKPGRNDLSFFAGLIPNGSKILDLGSGNGELLQCLKQHGASVLQGVDIDFTAITSCVKRDIPVIHLDLNSKLDLFPDNHFDYVILSLTLQSIKDTEQILSEIVRVGKQAIISIPNFAYYKLREMLYTDGVAPISNGVLHYEWYNTPNIRFFSISDFERLCITNKISIIKKIAIDTESEKIVETDSNRFADIALYVIQQNR
ncbi:MAG: homoserine O-acetyltransferase [Spirochaetes bacterium]|jgi:homoserine O-acetyltransferase|nr:homoserine O-acetyltransferase [Spirochaetota bacterium]